MHNLEQHWVITPSELLTKELSKIPAMQNSNVINITAWNKYLYRNIIQGKKLILSKNQQICLIRYLNPEITNLRLTQLINIWAKTNTEDIPPEQAELKRYMNYLKEYQLTDDHCIWRDIVNELMPLKLMLTFYGFAELMPNIKELYEKLSQSCKCKAIYPIINSNSIEVASHLSETNEISWLIKKLENAQGRTIVICENSAIIPILLASKIKPHCITSLKLSSTCLVKKALNILSTFVNIRYEASIWQKIIPNTRTMQAWLDKYSSCLGEKDLENLFEQNSETMIWQKIIEIKEYVSSLPTEDCFYNWAEYFRIILDKFSWLDNRSYTKQDQALINFWQVNLSRWANQDINKTILVSMQQALDNFIHECQSTNFRVEYNKGSNITIANLRESNGFCADSIIVIGANSKFSPEHSQDTFNMLKKQAKNLVFSYAEQIEDEPMQAFPPLVSIKPTRHTIQKPSKIETTLKPFVEHISLKDKPNNISSKMINEYAKCPIRFVFKALKLPHDLKAYDIANEINILRGIVCHEVMAEFWRKTNSRDNLLSLDAKQVCLRIHSLLKDSLAKHAKSYASLQAKMTLEVELEYLEKLILKLLEIEKDRPAFNVVHTEVLREIMIKDYKIKVRIDRVDYDINGYHLIDYKTGNVSPSNWLGCPPADPQIPLYLSDKGIDYSNVSYLQINRNNIGLKGFCNLRTEVQWPEFVSNARKNIDDLVTSIAGINHKTMPIDQLICSNCDLQTICKPKQIIKELIN